MYAGKKKKEKSRSKKELLIFGKEYLDKLEFFSVNVFSQMKSKENFLTIHLSDLFIYKKRTNEAQRK